MDTRETLEAEIQARDQFFSAVAHELRNPLNALHLTLAGLLRAFSGTQQPTTEQVVSRINRASAQVVRMAKLVDDMLDVSRISSGRLQLQFEDFDAAQVLADIIERLSDSQIASQISLSKPESLTIRCDRSRFALIATNIITNAIQFGLGKPIEVRLEEADSQITLIIADNGIGIAPEDQGRIFERFVKLNKDEQNVRFGVGLWIARELSRALEGDITVTSQPGEGSTFVVKLPKLKIVEPTPAG